MHRGKQARQQGAAASKDSTTRQTGRGKSLQQSRGAYAELEVLEVAEACWAAVLLLVSLNLLDSWLVLQAEGGGMTGGATAHTRHVAALAPIVLTLPLSRLHSLFFTHAFSLLRPTEPRAWARTWRWKAKRCTMAVATPMPAISEAPARSVTVPLNSTSPIAIVAGECLRKDGQQAWGSGGAGGGGCEQVELSVEASERRWQPTQMHQLTPILECKQETRAASQRRAVEAGQAAGTAHSEDRTESCPIASCKNAYNPQARMIKPGVPPLFSASHSSGAARGSEVL